MEYSKIHQFLAANATRPVCNVLCQCQVYMNAGYLKIKIFMLIYVQHMHIYFQIWKRRGIPDIWYSQSVHVPVQDLFIAEIYKSMLITSLPDPVGGDVCAKSGGGVVTEPREPHWITLQQASAGSGFNVHCAGTFWYVGHLNKICTKYTSWIRRNLMQFFEWNV